jgi:hypothetical protein
VSPRLGFVIGSYVAVAGAIAVGHWIDAKNGDVGLKVRPNMSIFAVIYIFAQAEERLLEPFARLWSGTEATVAQLRANKEIVFWAVATAIAAFACGLLGLRLLESVLDFGDNTPTTAFRFFDLGLTALVIGGGTKPLHDLIDRIQRPKTS